MVNKNLIKANSICIQPITSFERTHIYHTLDMRCTVGTRPPPPVVNHPLRVRRLQHDHNPMTITLLPTQEHPTSLADLKRTLQRLCLLTFRSRSDCSTILKYPPACFHTCWSILELYLELLRQYSKNCVEGAGGNMKGFATQLRHSEIMRHLQIQVWRAC